MFVLSLMCCGRVRWTNAETVTCEINPFQIQIKNGIVKVETFFINVTTKLERQLRSNDYIIISLMNNPNDKWDTQDFDINLMYECDEIADVDETIYCAQVEQNVFNLSKIVRVPDHLKSAKVQVFIIGGYNGYRYCECNYSRWERCEISYMCDKTE